MTDWYAVGGMMSQAGGRKDKHEAGSASGCVYAGNDITMPGMQSDFDDITKAFENPDAKYPLSKAELQTTAKRVLRTVLRLS